MNSSGSQGESRPRPRPRDELDVRIGAVRSERVGRQAVRACSGRNSAVLPGLALALASMGKRQSQAGPSGICRRYRNHARLSRKAISAKPLRVRGSARQSNRARRPRDGRPASDGRDGRFRSPPSERIQRARRGFMRQPHAKAKATLGVTASVASHGYEQSVRQCSPSTDAAARRRPTRSPGTVAARPERPPGRNGWGRPHP